MKDKLLNKNNKGETTDGINEQLTKIIRDAVNYRGQTPTCSTCEFSEERDNPFVKNDWYLVCTRHSIENGDAFRLGVFPVNESGTCEMHPKKLCEFCRENFTKNDSGNCDDCETAENQADEAEAKFLKDKGY